MLGIEYSWLISFTRDERGVPRASLGSGGLLTLTVALFCLTAVWLRAEPAATAPNQTETIVTGVDGILEGLAIHPTTGEAFFGDVHNRCIWQRAAGAGQTTLAKFSTDADGLLGVFAVKITADGKTLWASCSGVPEMKGCTPADQHDGFLAAYDLTTRRLLRKFPLPPDNRTHVLGDFLLAPDGTLFITDSLAPVIWRLTPGTDRLENWVENPAFKSLQGLVLDSEKQVLYVADYPNGLWQVSLATHAATLLPAPAGANLRGIDGLYAAPGGLIAVQNGLNPQRITRLALDASGRLASARVLLSGLPAMTDLSLGQVSHGRFAFIANSGWELYANPAATPAPRSVTVLSAPLD